MTLLRPALSGHAAGWASAQAGRQAELLAAAATTQALKLAEIQAALKCARSLVRTAEISSTLLEQK